MTSDAGVCIGAGSGGPASKAPVGLTPLQELEDIAYGLAEGYELRPNASRISALKLAVKQSKNPALKDMLKIWEDDHGVLVRAN
jgi:hypothetical protein